MANQSQNQPSQAGAQPAGALPPWLAPLVPIFADLIRRWLEDRLKQSLAPARGAAPQALMSDREADQAAQQLEQAVQQSGVQPAAAGQPQPAGHPGGLIQHVQELIAALRARDWLKVGDWIRDFVSHL